jgi:hypothetical protein
MFSMIAGPHKQQIPPLRFASVGMTTKEGRRSGRDDKQKIPSLRSQ